MTNTEENENADKMMCYCGHDCGRCVTYRATVEESDVLREQALLFYRNEFGLDIPPEKLRCRGARSGEVFYLCAPCPWMKCCKDRGLSCCKACPEYPCPPLAEYSAKYVNRCNQVAI